MIDQTEMTLRGQIGKRAASEFCPSPSRERVRQIEVRAFEKVQTAVKNRVAAIETPVGQVPRRNNTQSNCHSLRFGNNGRKRPAKALDASRVVSNGHA
jgi:hypothetical protein